MSLLIGAALCSSASLSAQDPVGGWHRPVWEQIIDLRDLSGTTIPDCTGDGVGDLLWQNRRQKGPFTVLDGRTGKPWLQSIDNPDHLVFVEVADFTGDGVADVLVRRPEFRPTNLAPPGKMQLLQGGTAQPLWELLTQQTGFNVGRSARVVDLDGDNLVDVLTFVRGEYVTALSGKTGRRLWYRSDFLTGDWCQVAPDANGDGIADIIFCGSGAITLVDGARGQRIWRRPTSIGNDNRDTEVYFEDLNADGFYEVILQEIDAYSYAMKRRIGVFDGEFGFQWWTCQSRHDYEFDQARCHFYDADGDGYQDILSVSPMRLSMVNGKTGRFMWTKEVWLDMKSSDHSSEPQYTYQVLDLNFDQVPDVIASSEYPKHGLAALDGRNGELLWAKVPADGSWRFEHFLAADLTGNGQLEVVAINRSSWLSGGSISVYEGQSGTLLWEETWANPGDDLGRYFLAIPSSTGQGMELVLRGARVLLAYHGADGSISWSMDAADSYPSAWYFHDLDGDVNPEVIEHNYSDDQILVLCPSQAQVWTHVVGPVDLKYFRGVVDDIDGDGRRDLVMDLDYRPIGSLAAYPSGKSSYTSGLELSADQLSASAGGVISMEIEMPKGFLFANYQLLLSDSARDFTYYNGLKIPLGPSRMLTRSQQGKYVAGMFYQPAGLLDQNSNQEIAVRAFPNRIHPSLVGSEINFAVFVERNHASAEKLCSGASTVTILP